MLIRWSSGELGSGGGPQSSGFQSSQVGRLVSDRAETIWFDWLANSVETSVTTGKNIWIQTNYEKNEIHSFCLFVFCCCTICPVSYFVCCFHFRNPLPPLWHFIPDIFHTIFSFAIESCVYETDFTLKKGSMSLYTNTTQEDGNARYFSKYCIKSFRRHIFGR